MAKDGNTYAKRQRETLKRLKAEAKRDRKRKRKDNPEAPGGPPVLDEPSALDASPGAT